MSEGGETFRDLALFGGVDKELPALILVLKQHLLLGCLSLYNFHIFEVSEQTFKQKTVFDFGREDDLLLDHLHEYLQRLEPVETKWRSSPEDMQGLPYLLLDETEQGVDEMNTQIAGGETGLVEGGEHAPEQGTGIQMDDSHVFLQNAGDRRTLIGILLQQTGQDVRGNFPASGEFLHGLADLVAELQSLLLKFQQLLVTEGRSAVVDDFQDGESQREHVHGFKFVYLHLRLTVFLETVLLQTRAVHRGLDRLPTAVRFLRVGIEEFLGVEHGVGEVVPSGHFLGGEVAFLHR
jgi:hypothetical protein